MQSGVAVWNVATCFSIVIFNVCLISRNRCVEKFASCSAQLSLNAGQRVEELLYDCAYGCVCECVRVCACVWEMAFKRT